MDDFIQFVNQSPTPYHFIQYSRKILVKNGFIELNPKEPYPNILPDKGFIAQNERTLICFSFGDQESIVGFCAHSDSACLKLKYNYSKSQKNTNLPKRKKSRKEEEICKSKYPEMLRLSMYGSGLWHTYLDRDLRIAGSVIYNDKNESEKNLNEINTNQNEIHQNSDIKTRDVKIDLENLNEINTNQNSDIKTRDLKIDLENLNKNEKVKFKLIDSEIGVAVIPNLSMHLAAIQSVAPNFNPELHFNAMFGSFPSMSKFPSLKSYIASLIGINECQISDWDLRFVDANPAISMNDLICGGRLDDLSSCYAGLMSFIQNRDKSTSPTQIFAVFDNAEANNVGVYSARSEFLNSIIECIYQKYYFLNCQSKFDAKSNAYISYCLRIKNKSILLSCNNDYGINPNYLVATNNTESNLGSGPFIRACYSPKTCSDLIGISIVEDASNSLYQTIEVRKDDRGRDQYTFGPHLLDRTGIRTIDIGMPMLSLHSIREVMHREDLRLLMRLISCLYSNTCVLEFSCDDYK